jgi:hypothetical protein
MPTWSARTRTRASRGRCARQDLGQRQERRRDQRHDDRLDEQRDGQLDVERRQHDNGAPVSNAPGATVTLPAESFTTGAQVNYTTTVACTGATPSSTTLPRRSRCPTTT